MVYTIVLLSVLQKKMFPGPIYNCVYFCPKSANEKPKKCIICKSQEYREQKNDYLSFSMFLF